MDLTPREKDKLIIFSAALLAERRKDRGLKLNYPEAVAYISFAILEGARDGKTVAELMSFGRTLLCESDVMPGIATLVPEIQVEATFPDGTKLVTVHQPIQPSLSDSQTTEPAIIPGEILVAMADEITLNLGRPRCRVQVLNTGDRPIQVGSHFHFYETNQALQFERETSRGYRLNIPAGTAVRFEPGQEREVELVAYEGDKKVYGFNAKIMGKL